MSIILIGGVSTHDVLKRIRTQKINKVNTQNTYDIDEQTKDAHTIQENDAKMHTHTQTFERTKL